MPKSAGREARASAAVGAWDQCGTLQQCGKLQDAIVFEFSLSNDPLTSSASYLLSSCSLPHFPYKMAFVPPFMWQPEEEREVRDCVCVCACVRVLEFKPGEVQHVRHKEGR